MKTPHKHAALIKAWADGAEIEYRIYGTEEWFPCHAVVGWYPSYEYRIKPESKPDVVLTRRIDLTCEPSKGFPCGLVAVGVWPKENLKLTFDGETGQLKAAEVL